MKMKINTFGFLLFVLFAIPSLNDAWASDDDLFDMDDDVFNTLGGFDEDFDELAEFEVNKKPQLCRIKNDHYPNVRCRKDSCLAVCKRELGSTEAKCRKSKGDKLKKCYCYKECDKPATPGKPDNHATPPSSPPAVSPAPHASPAYSPSGSPSPTPTPVASPAPSPVPVASPAYPPSSPAPEPASTLDPPCDDSDDVPPPPKKPSSVGEFSDEDFDFIFS